MIDRDLFQVKWKPNWQAIVNVNSRSSSTKANTNHRAILSAGVIWSRERVVVGPKVVL